MPFAALSVTFIESTESVSYDDAFTSAMSRAFIVAGSIPRPTADAVAVRDVRGALLLIALALKRTVLSETS